MMVSHVADLVDEDHRELEDLVDGSPSKKRVCCEAPKRIVKAEKEKLKREQLNEHFNRLASVLELSDPNHGKASILNESIRLVNDLFSQIQSLRRGSKTLLSEFHYMEAEKYELKDENDALESQIKKMESELEGRKHQSKPDLNVTPPECSETEMNLLQAVDPPTQQPPLGSLYLISLGPDLQTYQKDDTISNPPIAVTKPHARYPTSADSWPLNLLSKHPEPAS